ncbi:hypothetical protein [Vibrio fluvialis]|uniref:hypothetical protein n=1 Tax=Vibrio fluvialis TaxID=676 RepID=UPI001C9C8810|nr:hypothetical protein [Vibrio fluvialis]MBY7797767.1 hypothetical protein [Vibrio fluvialis]MBY8287340.1 hypothetical protein [Vibrio fluvialis]MCE7644908.1 hypothetical protein [Vibrio fluvialis]
MRALSLVFEQPSKFNSGLWTSKELHFFTEGIKKGDVLQITPTKKLTVVCVHAVQSNKAAISIEKFVKKDTSVIAGLLRLNKWGKYSNGEK